MEAFMPKRIRTMDDFVGLKDGQVVMLFGREALYLGTRLVKTYGCSCVPNCSEFPHVVRAKSVGISGDIELIEIRSLKKPQDQKITGVSIIHPIDMDHKEYLTIKRLLIAARLIPEQARVLNVFTTKSTMIVKPVWYFETDGRLNFRECKFEPCTSLADLPKTFTGTGKFAQTIEEAYKKSEEWANEN